MNATRRELLLGLAAGGAAIGAGWAGLPGPQACEAAALDAARRQAAHRRRRIIFNNDGDDIWAPGADSESRFLAVRHAPLLNTHVDSIFYCTTQSFHHFSHATKVAEVFTSKQGKFANNHLAAFLEQGTDGLRMSSRFARRHGLESIWTLRMNDIHDAWTPAFLPQWKREDATRVMSTPEAAKSFKDRQRLWSLVDFEHPDVQPRLLAIIDEVLANYDVDGVELDFLRAPCFFRSTFAGRPATDEQLDVMTILVRHIRSAVIQRSQTIGKPLLLTIRVPSTEALCRKIGIDIQRWLKDRLVDVMVLGGGYVTFDLKAKELIDLGQLHDVPVFPCLSQSGLLQRPPRGKSTRQPVEAWFGAASRLWQEGCDGIYSFNLFPNGKGPDTEYARRVLGTIGDFNSLAAEPTMYAISDAGWWMPSHYWAKDAEDFAAALPLSLKPNEFRRASLFVPEDLRGAGFDVTAELRVDFAGLAVNKTPQILFGSANFGPRKAMAPVGDVTRFVCNVPLSAIRQGPNRVMVKTEASGAKLAGAELWIKR